MAKSIDGRKVNHTMELRRLIQAKKALLRAKETVFALEERYMPKQYIEIALAALDACMDLTKRPQEDDSLEGLSVRAANVLRVNMVVSRSAVKRAFENGQIYTYPDIGYASIVEYARWLGMPAVVSRAEFVKVSRRLRKEYAESSFYP